MYNQKEIRLKYFAELVYEELEYGIKYEYRKETYFITHYKYARSSLRAFKIKD